MRYARAMSRRRHPSQFFRAGVGAVICGDSGLVLAFERIDAPGAWQLPQGGLEPEEEPLDGAYREVEEETGLPPSALVLEAQHPELLTYELPPYRWRPKVGRGQTQYWFLLRLVGAEELILPTPSEEFRAWKWTTLGGLARQVVEWRRPVYERLQREFGGRLAAEA